MTYRNPIVMKIIEAATVHYQGYDERRGNYKETSLDRWKFAELIIRECAEFIEQDQGSGEVLSHRLKEHFGVKDEPEN